MDKQSIYVGDATIRTLGEYLYALYQFEPATMAYVIARLKFLHNTNKITETTQIAFIPSSTWTMKHLSLYNNPPQGIGAYYDHVRDILIIVYERAKLS